MKSLVNIVSILLIILSLNACIKEEALNEEADILTMNIDVKILKRAPVISNNEIVCYLKAGASPKFLAPTFTITEGAEISPKSGTVRDFSKPQIYTVYSEDRQWHKSYKITFITSGTLKHYHFDNYELKDNKYHELYEEDSLGEKSVIWASGNSGFSFTAGEATPLEYPTSLAEEGFQNHSVKLTTCSTGALGEMFGSPIAAGSLFMGVFELDVSNPLKSTHFGMSVDYIPVSLKGHYKYKSGEVFKRYTDENGNHIMQGEVLDRRDSCAIYAVFYETSEETYYLNGTNILTHPNIISVAQLKQTIETEEWTSFDIPFVMKEGKTIDAEKLREGGYNLSIVFSSSKNGDLYNGAIGSTLFVDEVELVAE